MLIPALVCFAVGSGAPLVSAHSRTMAEETNGRYTSGADGGEDDDRPKNVLSADLEELRGGRTSINTSNNQAWSKQLRKSSVTDMMTQIEAPASSMDVCAHFDPDRKCDPDVDCCVMMGRHRDYYWITTKSGHEGKRIEPEQVVREYGVPEHVVLDHIREELEEEDAVKSLPFALVLVVLYALMNFQHDTQADVRSVESAIEFDIAENANWGFVDGPQRGTQNMGFKNYQDVTSYADFWSWMNRGMTAVWFISGRPTSEDSPLNLGPLPVEEQNYYLWHNRKIGAMRLMKEIAPSSECQNTAMSQAFSLNCTREPQFDLSLDPTDYDVSQMTFLEDSSSTVWLESDTWPDILRDLESNDWLNEQVYRIQVSICTYNPMKDLLILTNVHFLFSRAGHIWKRLTHRSFKLEPYEGLRDFLYDILFYTHISIIFFMEVIEVCKLCAKIKCHPMEFFKEYFNFWNVVDWVSIIVAYAMLGVWTMRYFKIKELENVVLNLPEELDKCNITAEHSTCSHELYSALYEEAEAAGLWIKDSNLLGAFYPVCIMMRLFKAFQAQPRLAMVSMTLYNSATDLAHFGIVFVAAFFSFVVMSIALFGREMTEFADFSRAFMSLFRALVGDFDYEEMSHNNRGIAFCFMALFMVTMFLIMLNMLVAIVMDVYAETKSQLGRSEPVWEECHEIMMRKWNNIRGNRMPFPKILDKYQKSRVPYIENPATIKVIKVPEFLNMVEGLKESQAVEIFENATEDWLATMHKTVELEEVLNTASMAAECAREIAEELDCRVRKVKRIDTGSQAQKPKASPFKPPLSSREVAEDPALSLEDLFKAAQLRLEQEFADRDDTAGDVDALRRMLASLALLSADRTAASMVAKPTHVPGLDLAL